MTQPVQRGGKGSERVDVTMCVVSVLSLVVATSAIVARIMGWWA